MSCVESVNFSKVTRVRPSYWQKHDLLLYVCGGSVQIRLGEQLRQIDRPSVIFLSHLEPHAIVQIDEQYERYAVQLAPALTEVQIKDAERLLSLFTDRSEFANPVIEVEAIAQPLRMMFDLLLQEHKKGDFADGQTALLQCILQMIYRHAPERFAKMRPVRTDTVRSIQRRFDENPADDVSIAELAQEHHLSLSYLTHSFKQATGYSIGRYRMLRRIASAKQMLISTNVPISTVSNACGFADLSNFCRYFRREVGCSPAAFRKRHTTE